MKKSHLNKSIFFTLLILSLLGSCAKKEEEDDDPVATVNIDMPELIARCKYTIPSSGFCDGTPNGSGGMNTNKGVLFLANSANEIVAMQLGDLSCGDSGGSLGVHCAMTTSTSGWIDQNLSSVAQIATGNYTFSFQLDKAGDVTNIVDIGNFGVGDTVCSASVTLTETTTTIADANATLFTCLTNTGI